MERVRRGVLIALVACAVLAGSARADGDPASDLLITQNVFVPFQAPDKSETDGLAKQVSAVYVGGDRIKVAVIGSKVDLGAIPSLFDKPTDYAKFLGQELSGFYIGPLLVVMPTGYGIYDGGRATNAEDAVIAKLSAAGSADSNTLVAAATTAVSKLEQAHALHSPDILRPFVETIGATLKGKKLTVRFYLADDSGKASAKVSLLSKGKIVFTTALPTHPTSISKIESHVYKLRSTLVHAGLSACVKGTDGAGNHARSCFKLES
jgi:hypothetical protein